MIIQEQPCFYCSAPLVTAVTKAKIYCSNSCTQKSYRLKQKLAPNATQKEWRLQVTQRVIAAHQKHPNPSHTANQVLELVQVKLSELQELIAIKNQLVERSV